MADEDPESEAHNRGPQDLLWILLAVSVPEKGIMGPYCSYHSPLW